MGGYLKLARLRDFRSVSAIIQIFAPDQTRLQPICMKFLGKQTRNCQSKVL